MTAPSMAEVLAEHRWVRSFVGCRCGFSVRTGTPMTEGRAQHDQHVAQALAAAGFGHVASELDERFAESDHKAAAYWRRLREAERRAEAAEAQVADLQRWKDEALPVMDGLQELGRALNLPLGERVTGERALEAVQALVAQVARVQALLDAYMAWDGDRDSEYGSSPLQREQLRRALDGEGGR